MKQLPMTPALIALIRERVGQDVDPTNFAVFETIALNTRPLPGKRGSLFEDAVVMPQTLKEMVDHIVLQGNHLPLIADHELFGAPKGRVFHAGLDYDAEGLNMRQLFYLDPTEGDLIAKLNAGSLDEVSVAFLSSKFLCSECGWDYFQFGASENIYERTCGNGHKIGQGGVHGELTGLNQFIELSLVARGAADKPKIVGKSEARLAPEAVQRLAANGFQTDALVVQASMGTKEEKDMSAEAITALTGQLTTLSQEKGSLTTQLSTVTSERDAARTELSARDTRIAELTTQLAAVTTERDTALARPDASVGTERDEALTFLQEQVDHLLVASGKSKLEGEAKLKTVAENKAKIVELTGGLTSILPVGGKSAPAGGTEGAPQAALKINPAAYSVRK